jgi:hypothetical protein
MSSVAKAIVDDELEQNGGLFQQSLLGWRPSSGYCARITQAHFLQLVMVGIRPRSKAANVVNAHRRTGETPAAKGRSP